MALGTTNITTAIVKSVLGEDSNAVSHLVTSPYINKWSRHKPTTNISRDVFDFGLTLTSGTLNAIPTGTWTYRTRTSDFRLGDFREYNHTAVPPTENEVYQVDDTYETSAFFPPDFLAVNDITMSEVMAEIGSWSEWHFGVAMKSSSSQYIYSVNSQNIKPTVLTTGTYFHFSNAKFYAFPATGTYNYVAFLTPNYESALDLILNSELSGTQENYPVFVLPNGYGSFQRITTPPVPQEPLFAVGFLPTGFAVTGTVTRGDNHVHYTITNSTGSAKNIDVTLIVTQNGVQLYDSTTNSITSETGVNVGRTINTWHGALADYDQVFTISIAYT